MDYVKNTFKILVLFDTFSDIFDKGFLPHIASFHQRIGANWLSPEYHRKRQIISEGENGSRLARSDSLDDAGEIW